MVGVAGTRISTAVHSNDLQRIAHIAVVLYYNMVAFVSLGLLPRVDIEPQDAFIALSG